MKKTICLIFVLVMLLGCQDNTNKVIDDLNDHSNFEYELLTVVTDEISENHAKEYGFGSYRLVDSTITEIDNTDLNDYLRSHETTFYTVSAYPDYSDGGEYITRIETTDTSIDILGFYIGEAITIDEVTKQMEALGYTQDINNSTIYSNGPVGIQLYIDDVIYRMDVFIEISNADNIVF